MKKLPIGIQGLRKTPLVARLAQEGSYYFLARPRRFGKSLLVDTLAEIPLFIQAGGAPCIPT